MADQKTIAFFPEAAFGPALNSVGIAQACRDLGHRAVFIADPGFTGVFSGYGFEEFHVNMSEPMPPEEMAKYWSDFINGHIPNFSKSPYDQIDNYVKDCWEAIVETSVWAEKELPDILAKIGPDLICIDNVVLFPATKQYGVPWVRIISCSENEIASSPYAKSGELWAAHQRYFGKGEDRGLAFWRRHKALYWVAPSTVMNPSLDPAEIEAKIEKDPASGRAEYLPGGRNGRYAGRCGERLPGCVRRLAPRLLHYHPAGHANPPRSIHQQASRSLRRDAPSGRRLLRLRCGQTSQDRDFVIGPHYGHIKAVRALGRESINTVEIARALSISVRKVEDAVEHLESRGVRHAR